MTDTYDSVHRLLPLALDAETGVLRFARVNESDTSALVASPVDLPDAALDLFVFDSNESLTLWISGVREVATNAIDVVVPEMQSPRFCLLVRHDRERRTGERLDEVVALHDRRKNSKGEEMSLLGDRLRAEESRHLAIGASRDAFETHWAEEMAVVRQARFLEVDRNPFGMEDVEVLSTKGSRRQWEPTFEGRFDVRKSAAGHLLSWKSAPTTLDADLQADVRAFASSLGLEPTDEGFQMHTDVFDVDFLGRALSLWVDVRDATGAAKLRARYRVAVAADEASSQLKKIVVRAAAGFLPVLSTLDFSCRQASPTQGRALDMSTNHVRHAIKVGYLEYVWSWGDRADEVVGGVLDVTEVGKAFCEGRTEDVVEHLVKHGTTPVAGMKPTTTSSVPLSKAVRVRSGIGERVRKALSVEAGAMSDALWTRDPKAGYAIVAACLANGIRVKGF